MTPAYLPLPLAAAHLSRSSRWLRRRLDQIPHYRPPEGQILFKLSDLEGYLERFRIEPVQPRRVDLDAILNDIDRAPRRRTREGKGIAG